MNVVIIGAQWGDEGKGKIVDYLADGAEAVVRYAGGANAGHTIVISGEQYALHLVPSGILYPEKTVYLGTGMVIDPQALFEELAMLEKRGIDWKGRVFISDRAHLVLPRYRRIDRERDALRTRPIGTTGRGIGTAYACKSERDGIRIADLCNDHALANLTDEDKDFLAPYRDLLLEMKTGMTEAVWQLKGRNVLLEGAQGALLDIDSGTYPYVSSGLSCSAGAAIGAGMGPRDIDRVLGVFKAYSTRVGNGPMPSEFNDQSQNDLCTFIRNTGREYGVTTGRPRRCGFLDLVALRYACRANSIDSLVLTHLDVYNTLEHIEACVAYRIDGRERTDFPADIGELDQAKPVLKAFPGWQCDLKGIDRYEDLPAQARSYIDCIEDFTGVPVSIISTGPDRNDTFIRSDPWK